MHIFGRTRSNRGRRAQAPQQLEHHDVVSRVCVRACCWGGGANNEMHGKQRFGSCMRFRLAWGWGACCDRSRVRNKRAVHKVKVPGQNVDTQLPSFGEMMRKRRRLRTWATTTDITASHNKHNRHNRHSINPPNPTHNPSHSKSQPRVSSSPSCLRPPPASRHGQHLGRRRPRPRQPQAAARATGAGGAPRPALPRQRHHQHHDRLARGLARAQRGGGLRRRRGRRHESEAPADGRRRRCCRGRWPRSC